MELELGMHGEHTCLWIGRCAELSAATILILVWRFRRRRERLVLKWRKLAGRG
jgi:hypothetical protein